MSTIAESKDAVLRVMRGEDPEKVLDGLLEQPVDQVDQDGPHKPTIEDYGPEELEQMQQSASDSMVKMEAVYGNMLKHDRNAAEACEECMEEMRTAAERCQTDPVEGAYDMHKAMGEMCDALGDDAYEGSDDDTSDIQTVMGEMVDVYEEFNIKLGGSDPNVDQGDDGETSPGKPGGGVKVDVSGIRAGRGARSEQDDDDEEMPDDDDELEPEPDEEEPDERHRPGHEDDDEEPEAELGMDDEEPEPEEDDMPPEKPMGDEEPTEQEKCPVCGAKMEYSEEAGMNQCAECGYERAEMNTHDDEEMPAEDPGMEEPELEPDEQDAEPEDGEEMDDEEPEPEDDEEEPAMEARSCPHCRQPMKEDTQRGKNVCTFCKFELDLGA